MDNLKTCCRCKEVKARTEFNKRKDTKDGLLHYCKDCHRLANKKSYMKDPEKHKARCRIWQDNNVNKQREIDRKYYKKNKEKVINWHVSANQRRRALIHTNIVDKDITLDKVYEKANGICGICGNYCIRKKASLDHIRPLSKGGTHTWDNIQLAHFNCNSKKGDKLWKSI